MKEIIQWQMEIEDYACNLYRKASDQFNDPVLVQFLEQMHEDELFHYQIMKKALNIIDDYPEIKSPLVIDDEIKSAIKKFFSENYEKIQHGDFTKEALIDSIVNLEFSEWNEIFIFVVNSLKHISPEFKPVVPQIQRHLNQIEHFLRSDKYGRKVMAPLLELEPVWTERILIIDDDPIISNLLEAITKTEGIVDIAENGEQGLKMLREHYYRLIISDINMPVMDGICLFKMVVKEFPGIDQRYMFLSGYPTPEIESFLKEHKVPHYLKPISLIKLKEHILAAMHNVQQHVFN